jgi:YD repeat-containing protein
VVGSDGASCGPPAPDPKNLGPCKTCTGNPINTGIGNKFETETDYTGAGPFPLVFRRTYNSLPANGANMGAHWRAGFDRRIGRLVASGVNTAVMYRDDGKIYNFSLANGVFTGPADIADRLTLLTDSGGFITGYKYVTSPGDETEIYKPTGQLLSISARNGLKQTFGYDGPGRLSSITDTFGRSLALTYDASNRIATMTDPAGGVYQYAYDANNNLVSVTYPGNPAPVKTYVYDEPANTAGANLPNAPTRTTISSRSPIPAARSRLMCTTSRPIRAARTFRMR